MPASISLIQGDITRLDADAIVNAANNALLDGAGVNGAIHRAAGAALENECRILRQKKGGCPTGAAVITRGGQLAARWVIHTVGPVWQGGQSGEAALLASCYRSSLSLADLHDDIQSIAFPNISTGIFGFPRPLAAQIAIDTVRAELPLHPRLTKLIFCCYDPENFSLYRHLLPA